MNEHSPSSDYIGNPIKPLPTDLILCNACRHSISVLAAVCTNCGAPNTWRHPGIVQFLQVKDATGVSRAFTFSWDKFTIKGRTKPKRTIFGYFVLFALLPVIFVLWAFLAWWLAFIVSTVLYAYALGANMRTEYFVVNLFSGEWTSSNEKFWKPVRDKLER